MVCGDHRKTEEILLRPIAKSIRGEVKVGPTARGERQVLTDTVMTVDLFFGEAKVATTQTDATHRFVFEGVLSGAYTVRVSDAVRPARGADA